MALSSEKSGKIPSGTDVEVMVEKSLRRDVRLHNSPTIRNAFNAQLMQQQELE